MTRFRSDGSDVPGAQRPRPALLYGAGTLGCSQSAPGTGLAHPEPWEQRAARDHHGAQGEHLGVELPSAPASCWESPAWHCLASPCQKMCQKHITKCAPRAHLVPRQALTRSSQPLPSQHRLSPFSLHFFPCWGQNFRCLGGLEAKLLILPGAAAGWAGPAGRWVSC